MCVLLGYCVILGVCVASVLCNNDECVCVASVVSDFVCNCLVK